MADWVTISALATAGGTLVLAGTAYASVRSANRAARVAETSLLAGLRPLLIQSAEDDPAERVPFADGVALSVPGGGAAVELVDGRVYSGRRGTRFASTRACRAGGRFGVELLYGDYEGGQRVVTRFGVSRDGDRWNAAVARHWQIDRPNPR